MSPRLISFAVLCLASLTGPGLTADPATAERFTYRLTGLFAPDREADLREVFTEIPGVSVVAVNYADAELTVEFVPAKVFPGAKPAQYVERLDQQVRQLSRSTFSVKPRSTIPRDQLTEVVIPAAGLDCKACCLAAYEAVAAIDGVVRATASFRDGQVTARIDPTKTDRGQLEAALRKRGVAVGK